ncbi:hypothetical protein D3C80_1792470 [compost metagenome]
MTLAMPPTRKKIPITIAKRILRLPAINAAIQAPTRVPRAWARNGKIKCLGSNRCIEAFSPSVVVTSAPFGGGIMEPLIMIRPILTILPITRPATIARMFRKIGCMFFVLSEP